MKNFDKIVDKSIEIMAIEFAKNADVSSIKNILKRYYEMLIYNITSIVVVIALTHNLTKIKSNHMEYVKDYVKSKCNMIPKSKGGCGSTYNPNQNQNSMQSGGSALPSEYCGYSIDPSPYSAGNGGEQSVSTVDFENGIARQAIDTSASYNGQMFGGAKTHSAELVHFICVNKDVKKYVREILKHHTITVDKRAMHILLHLIEIHIHCVLKDLKNKGPLTMTKIEKVFNSKSHAIFN
jgi:hypothetical protein